MSTAPGHEAAESAAERAKPPFLRRVRIRNYKSIAFCDVTLGPLTVLVGRNASGKSNFVDALAFLRDVVSLGVNEAVKRHGGADAINCRLQNDRIVSIEIECGYTIASDADRWTANYRICIALLKKRPCKIQYENLRIEQGNWWIGYSNDDGQVVCRAADDGAALDFRARGSSRFISELKRELLRQFDQREIFFTESALHVH